MVEQNDYYPFGGRHANAAYAASDNRFRFSGKEDQTTGALNLLDYGARMYDPALGRWFNVDPLAEWDRALNPYHYCANNPVRYIDLFGLKKIPYDQVNPATFDFDKDVVELPTVTIPSWGRKDRFDAEWDADYQRHYEFGIGAGLPGSERQNPNPIGGWSIVSNTYTATSTQELFNLLFRGEGLSITKTVGQTYGTANGLINSDESLDTSGILTQSKSLGYRETGVSGAISYGKGRGMLQAGISVMGFNIHGGIGVDIRNRTLNINCGGSTRSASGTSAGYDATLRLGPWSLGVIGAIIFAPYTEGASLRLIF